MKKNMLKLAIIPALMLGAVSLAHAKGDASVDIQGTITNTSCDLLPATNLVSLGNHTPDEFADNTTPIATQTFKLNVKHCTGGLKANQPLVVSLTGPTYTGDPSLNLWGDPNTSGVGIDLQAKGNYESAPTDFQTIGHADFDPTSTDHKGQDGFVIYQSATDVADLGAVTIDAADVQVGLRAAFMSTDSTPKPQVTPGLVKAKINFTMSYI